MILIVSNICDRNICVFWHRKLSIKIWSLFLVWFVEPQNLDTFKSYTTWDAPALVNNSAIADFTNDNPSNSFKFKGKISDQKVNDGIKSVEIIV